MSNLKPVPSPSPPNWRLAAIIRSSDDAIISKTLDGIITTWNPAAEKLFGYTADEAMGRPISMLVPPELGHQEPEIQVAIRQGRGISRLETTRIRKDGRRVEVS